MSVEDREALELVDFWLGAGPQAWFSTSEDFDERCRRWLPLREKAIAGECAGWTRTAAGSLALILLLDQIPRNSLRESAEQYATDPLALDTAGAAIAAGHDLAYAFPAKNFFYLPYQHAEDMSAQERGLDLYRRAGNQEFYYWALVHADAVRRFGRFPHRNAMLGRQTTDAERAYLQSGGFGA